MKSLQDLQIGCTAGGTTHHDTDIPDIATKVRMVKDAGVFDYIDRCPPDDEFRDLLRASEQCDLPVASSGWFYTLGRDEVLFERNIHKARLLGSTVHNVQMLTHHADGHVASNQEVADFYCWAHETGMRHGVVPCFEVHVNMWSEHFGRVAQVAALVQARGLPFHMTLDHSHVIFKIGNPQELAICGLTNDVAAGRVVLDPFQPGNLVDQWLSMGIVRWLQVRSVAPGGPRNLWSINDPASAVAAVPTHSIFPYRAGEPGRGILYPFTRPGPGAWHSPWHEDALAMTKEVVRKVLAHHRTDPDARLRAITTEMINLPDYAHNARFSLIGENAAIARFVRDSWDAAD